MKTGNRVSKEDFLEVIEQFRSSVFMTERLQHPEIDPKDKIAYQLVLERYILIETFNRTKCQFKRQWYKDAYPIPDEEYYACRKYAEKIDSDLLKIALDKKLTQKHLNSAQQVINRYSFEKAKQKILIFKERLLT